MVVITSIALQFILMPFMSGIIQFTLVILIISFRLFKIVTDTVGFHVAERHAKIFIYNISLTDHVIFETLAFEGFSRAEYQMATLV